MIYTMTPFIFSLLMFFKTDGPQDFNIPVGIYAKPAYMANNYPDNPTEIYNLQCELPQDTITPCYFDLVVPSGIYHYVSKDKKTDAVLIITLNQKTIFKINKKGLLNIIY